MIDFRSDTVTRPTPAMREVMAAAPVGDDVFGDDPSINALQDYAADLLGFDAALFAPSGTQTNLIALMAQCQRGDEAIVGQQWHTYRFEAGGMAVLGSIQPQPLENQPDGTIRVSDIAATIKPDDAHFARSRLIGLENTTGGKVLPMGYLAEVNTLARTRGLVMHLDGARLFNAATAIASARLQNPEANRAARPSATVQQPGAAAIHAAAREICSHFHTVSVCLSKGLGAPVGSLVLGSRATIARARRIRKILGGGMRQAGILASAGLYALQHHVARLPEDHANAARLAEGLTAIAASPGRLEGRMKVSAPDTNILFVDVDSEVALDFQRALDAVGVGVTGGTYHGGQRQRWVTHLDVNRNDVESALDMIAAWSRSEKQVATSAA